MIRFNNDYNHGAFASILKELGATNSTSYAGYGEDEWCDKAETIIKKLVDNDNALIKFIPGATQANYVVITAALSSVQSVIAADTGHINCHEAASIENTGHKILELPNTDGKITAQQIAACAKAFFVVFLLMWIKWTFPRLRIDQILNLEWKYLVPISMVNLLLMACCVAFGFHF